MIEMLPGMPKGVAGIRGSGRLQGDDFREFKPAMENLLKIERAIFGLDELKRAKEWAAGRCRGESHP